MTRNITVVGLGYVGLSLSLLISKKDKVVGLDNYVDGLYMIDYLARIFDYHIDFYNYLGQYRWMDSGQT